MGRRVDQPSFMDGDYVTGVVAAGTSQSDATTLPASHCEVGTATVNQGVVLKQAPENHVFTVLNTSGASILVYPPSGAGFNGNTANLPLNLPDGVACFGRFLSKTIIATQPVAAG